MSQIYEKEEIFLTRGDAGKRETFRFRICEHLPAENAKRDDCKLIIQAIGLTAGAALAIDINGKAVASSDVVWDLEADPPTGALSVSDPPFQFGDNQLGLTLTESTANEGTITVERLDCFVP